MIKTFFNIDEKFRFEMNDLRALTMVINVALIMIIGFQSAWFGLSLAVCGLVKDCTNKHRHINDFLIHISGTVLNTYFLFLLYS